MAKRNRPAVERYHDRVAGIYDTIYDGDPYWEAVFQLTWQNILRHLPKDQSARCLDLGCGTGRWGLRLAKAGYRTDFLDISQKMLDQAATKLASLGKRFVQLDLMSVNPPSAEAVAAAGESAASLFYHASVDDMSGLPAATYDFVVGQGDPLNCAEKPRKAFKELTRLLRPGGVVLLSVDNRLQGMEHYFRDRDIEGLEAFLRTGRTTWVTDVADERFPLTMFTPGQIRGLCRERGLELLGMIGKTVLPLRRYKELLADPETRNRLLRLEESLQAEEALFANAPHLEFAARLPRQG